MSDYDVIVIGAGPAGSMAAIHAAELGAKVAVIERNRTGGTCTNSGCVPTRVLAKTARLLRDIRGADAYGIVVDTPQLVWERTLERVRQVIEDVHSNKRLTERMREAGADVFYEGAARFIDPHTIRLSDSNRELSARAFIVCVGGHSRRLPIPGAELAMYPEQILDLHELPRSVVIVGSGYTGVQLTTCLNAFGADVTLLEMAPRMLPPADQDVSRVLRDSFRDQGVTVEEGITGVDAIEQPGDRKHVRYTINDEQRTVTCDAVLLCAGWPANVDGLGLQELGVDIERGFYRVNEYLQTNLEHVFVAGDANGQGMLVQGAYFEAYAAAENAVHGPRQNVQHELMPSGGFTDPDHAAVGLTEEQARKQCPDCQIVTAQFHDLDRAIIDSRTVGFLKLIVDPATDHVIGAHAAGEFALEVIQAVATAMVNDVTATSLASVQFAYPTYTQIIGAAAAQLAPGVGHASVKPLAGNKHDHD